jgi:hypothetical protein
MKLVPNQSAQAVIGSEPLQIVSIKEAMGCEVEI